MGQARRRAMSGESKPKLPPEVELAVKKSMEHPMPCASCNSSTLNRGVYIAGDPNRVSTPKGKSRYVVYPICDECLDSVKHDPRILTSIEDEIETRALSISVNDTEH